MEEVSSRSDLMTALYVTMSVSFRLPHPVAVSDFIICRGLCACTEMPRMCVLHVSFGYKERPRTVGCVAMVSAVSFILRSRLLVYSAGSGVNRVKVVLSGFSVRLLSLSQIREKSQHTTSQHPDVRNKQHTTTQNTVIHHRH